MNHEDTKKTRRHKAERIRRMKVATIGKRMLGLAVLSLLIIPGLQAQKVGSTSMQFLKVMPVARATALGEAYSVWASGAEAVFWNPGGVARVNGHEISTTYIDWLFDTQQGAISYALSLGDLGALGFQFQYVDFGIFEETSNARPFINDPNGPGLTGRTFRPFSYLMGVTYARYLTDRFSVGFAVKFVHESLFDGQQVAVISPGFSGNVDTWANGILFDFGIRYNTGFRSVHVATSVQNFGADVRFARESSPVPLLFRFGIAADLLGENALLVSGHQGSSLRTAFDIFHPNDYSQQAHIGLEYEFDGFLFVRAGYKANYDYEGFTFGGGLRQTVANVGLSLDYSYGPMGTYLSGAQRITIGAIIP